MLKVKTTEVSSRLGDFTLIKLGGTVLISRQCDSRMKILSALAEGPLTSEELRERLEISYSAVMDHMDFFEAIGLVRATLVRKGRNGNARGRRRITFHLTDNPLEAIEELFMSAPKNGKSRSARKAIPGPSIEV